MAIAIHKDKQNSWTSGMLEDFRNDICIFVATAIEGRMPPPYQRLRLRAMAEKRFFADNSGFATAKTRNAAHFVAWMASCFGDSENIDAGRTVATLSHTFRGAKLIFNYIDGWYLTKPEFRKQFAKKPSHFADVWEARFKNNSVIRCLPSNIINNSQGLEGERWTDVVVDEIKGFSPDVVRRVIETRVNKPWDELKKLLGKFTPDKILQNHTIYMGTAWWKFSPIYKDLIKFIVERSEEGHPDYGYQSWSYLDIPKEWQSIMGVDLKLIEKHKREMPKCLFDMYYMGKWQESSQGFYPAEQVYPLQKESVKVETKGDKDGIYILGIDPAGSEARSDFGLCVWKIVGGDVHLVNVYRKRRILMSGSPDAMKETTYSFCQKFPVRLIVIDWGGGGSHLAGELGILPEGVRMPPIVKLEELEKDGQHIICMFKGNSKGIQALLGKDGFSGDDMIVGRSHTLFQTAIENQRVVFAGSCKEDSEIEEEILENINNTIKEIIMIERKTDATGDFKITSRGQFDFMSKGRKDCAYSALYGYVGTEIYRKLYESSEGDDEDGFYTKFSEVEEEVGYGFYG